VKYTVVKQGNNTMPWLNMLDMNLAKENMEEFSGTSVSRAKSTAQEVNHPQAVERENTQLLRIR